MILHKSVSSGRDDVPFARRLIEAIARAKRSSGRPFRCDVHHPFDNEAELSPGY
jgi:hypothetical protein